MKTRITAETFGALSFEVSLKQVLASKEEDETQHLKSQLPAPEWPFQSPPSVPRTGESEALETNCEAHGGYEPMVLEQWLIKQQFASTAALCVLAPPADSLPKSAGGFNFYWVPQ